MVDRPRIICLCGSTRFSEAFQEATLRETLAGHIVLSIGCVWHSDEALGLTEEDKERLDELHRRKIDLADSVLFLNVNGYMGQSTLIEHFYAASLGKTLRYLEPPGYETLYVRAHEAGIAWLKEQQAQGRYLDGLEPIDRCTWFKEDV